LILSHHPKTLILQNQDDLRLIKVREFRLRQKTRIRILNCAFLDFQIFDLIESVGFLPSFLFNYNIHLSFSLSIEKLSFFKKISNIDNTKICPKNHKTFTQHRHDARNVPANHVLSGNEKILSNGGVRKCIFSSCFSNLRLCFGLKTQVYSPTEHEAWFPTPMEIKPYTFSGCWKILLMLLRGVHMDDEAISNSLRMRPKLWVLRRYKLDVEAEGVKKLRNKKVLYFLKTA